MSWVTTGCQELPVVTFPAPPTTVIARCQAALHTAALRCWFLSWSGPVIPFHQGQTFPKGKGWYQLHPEHMLALIPEAVTLLQTTGSRGPFLCCGPGSAVQLPEVCSAHKCTFFLLRVELPSDRAETEQLLWWSHACCGAGDLRQPPSSHPRTHPAPSTMELTLGGSPTCPDVGDQSGWQETEDVTPVAVVQTV